MKCQGTGKICSFYQGFVYTVYWDSQSYILIFVLDKISVCHYIGLFLYLYSDSLHQGCTVLNKYSPKAK